MSSNWRDHWSRPGAFWRISASTAIAVAFAVVFAANVPSTAFAQAEPLLHQVGTVDGKPTNCRNMRRSGYLLFTRRVDNHDELFSLDPKSGQSEPLARLPSYATGCLYWNQRYVLLAAQASESDRTEVILVDRASARQLARWHINGAVKTAAVVNDTVQIIRGRQPQYAESNLIFSLNTFERLGSAKIPDWFDEPLPVFWRDRIILIYRDRIELHTNRFEKLASAARPKEAGHGDVGCSAARARTIGHRLIFSTTCGGFAVFDLDRFRLERTMPPFDPSHSLDYDVAGNLLFAVPNGQFRRENNGAVFDLNSGKRLAVLPITGDVIAVRGDTMALARFRGEHEIVRYHIDLARILDTGRQVGELLTAYSHARMVLAHGGTVYDALDAIETAPTEQLLDPSSLDPALRPAAIDYAAWLAASFNRRGEGLALLKKLSAAMPDDEHIKRRLAGALYEKYLITGSTEALAAATSLVTADPAMPELERQPPTSAIRGARIPIPFRNCVPRIYFALDKAFIDQSCNSSRIGVYDRDTLRHLGDVALGGDKVTFPGTYSAIALNDGRILVAINDGGPVNERDNLVVIDPTTLKITRRVRFDAAIDLETLVGTRNGIVTCGSITTEYMPFRCRLRDPHTFDVIPSPLDKDKDPIFLPERVDLAALIRAWSQPSGRHDTWGLEAMNDKWMVVNRGSWDRYELAFRSLAGGDWQSIKPTMSMLSEFDFCNDGETAVFAYRLTDRERIMALDLQRSIVGPIIEVPFSGTTRPEIAFAGKLLLIGLGRDLLVYDLGRSAMGAYYKDVIVTPERPNANPVPGQFDPFAIGRMVVDQNRLIIMTNDGSHSRLIELPQILSQLAESAKRFATANNLILGK